MNDIKMTVDGIHAYDIIVSDSFSSLKDHLEPFDISHRKVCIVTEDGVGPYYLEEIRNLIGEDCAALRHFIFAQGEENKNLDTVSRLYEYLIQEGFDRKDLLVALGGGVTGDLTGFAAATYLRGIDFIQIPTSLLSQVDSSIGGKTGVDFSRYKNMVGAFYMPKLVFINIGTLKTLPERQFLSGLGEVIKHGLIRDRSYYEWIEEHREEILAGEPEVLKKMVEGSCKIKKEVVEIDPKEQGIRATLNYGHTLGHAIEKMSRFRLTHGECVAIGSCLAADISVRKGLLSGQDYRKIRETYRYFGYPGIPEEIKPEDIVEAARHDKKMEKGKLKFILLHGIGNAVIDTGIKEEDMLACLYAAKRGDES